ncbi:hypothetical protein HMPREF0880_02452 [Yokenella regensburgei ATCC 43003]|nr:hypothetical protein HMPREF0880_02452 [Yokenella regensburgei ATCC 43003]
MGQHIDRSQEESILPYLSSIHCGFHHVAVAIPSQIRPAVIARK